MGLPPAGVPPPHLGDLGVELRHVGAEHLPKFAEHLLVPSAYFRFTFDWTCREVFTLQLPCGQMLPSQCAFQAAEAGLPCVIYDHGPNSTFLVSALSRKESRAFLILDQQRLPPAEVFPGFGYKCSRPACPTSTGTEARPAGESTALLTAARLLVL